MEFLADLQSRIPDRWYFRRLLPAAVYVVLVVLGGHQLGQAHASGLAMARGRLAADLRADGGSVPKAVASLILFATAVAICAFAVPVVAAAIEALVRDAWPWWLTPLGRCQLWLRRLFWASPEDREDRELALLGKGRWLPLAFAERLRRLRQRSSTEPELYTWSAERFEATRRHIDDAAGLKITNRWTDLLFVMPDAARAILTGARDSYDGACEALAWSIALLVLGAWWWPAAGVGLLLGLVSWRWLRRSVTGLCEASEAAARVYGPQIARSTGTTVPANEVDPGQSSSRFRRQSRRRRPRHT